VSHLLAAEQNIGGTSHARRSDSDAWLAGITSALAGLALAISKRSAVDADVSLV